MKETAIVQWLSAFLEAIKPNNRATITTKYPKIFHSAFKKAIAPSAI